MPRLNKVTERVFTDLSKTSIEDFLRIDEVMNLQVSSIHASMKKAYNALSKEAEFIEVLENLASVEEIIVQLRCKQVINSELRLSLSRNYIYARSLFYRRGKEINDIRVVVGLTNDFGSDIESLIKNTFFRVMATRKLEEAMDKEIEKNLFQLNIK
jgi:hypothetical protein